MEGCVRLDMDLSETLPRVYNCLYTLQIVKVVT